jgi:hypothetical protein
MAFPQLLEGVKIYASPPGAGGGLKAGPERLPIRSIRSGGALRVRLAAALSSSVVVPAAQVRGAGDFRAPAIQSSSPGSGATPSST